MKTIKVVAAVITDAGRIFAARRGYGEYKDMWEFPGGKIEPGETSKEALSREIREELGVEISVGESLGTVEYDYPAFHLSMESFLCSLRDGSPILKEHEAAAWLTKENIGSVDWLPADLLVIDQLKAKLPF